MAALPVRASAGWLALREPADAAARSTELVDELVSFLPERELVVHDLGCGTGSMARWLAPLLPGSQRWVLHDRDRELLDRVELASLEAETRHDDITRLDQATLADADLVTASALLDMMTADELARFVRTCARVGCPVLITLSVVGRVELTPEDPLDPEVMAAFNAHQRRDTTRGRLLGPNASPTAAQAFTARGRTVVARPSPWHLGPDRTELLAEWFTGWLAAAGQRRPAMERVLGPYARRRLAAAADGSLFITVHHEDLLVWPAPRTSSSRDERRA
jgi:SAM-dependent methyltransferase